MKILEEALEEGNWEKVAEAYKILTGKVWTLTPAPEARKQERGTAVIEEEPEVPNIISEEEEIEVDEYGDSDSDDEIEEDDAVIDDDGDRVKCRRVSFDTSKKKNSWKDNKQIAVKDIEIDKKLHRGQTERNIEIRPKAKKVKVKCSECSRDSLLPAFLAPAKLGESGKCRYVCDKCITHKRGKD